MDEQFARDDAFFHIHHDELIALESLPDQRPSTVAPLAVELNRETIQPPRSLKKWTRNSWRISRPDLVNADVKNQLQRSKREDETLTLATEVRPSPTLNPRSVLQHKLALSSNEVPIKELRSPSSPPRINPHILGSSTAPPPPRTKDKTHRKRSEDYPASCL